MSRTPLKEKLHEIIFGTETRAGRLFDVFLLWFILASAFVVILESVQTASEGYGRLFFYVELFFTAVFTIEYLLRIWISPDRKAYIFSIWGIVDFLSILPFYMSLIIAGYQYFLIARLFRLMRVFRILKLFRFLSESQQLMAALRNSLYKIGIFIFGVITIVVFIGTIMYVIEGPENGYTSIPQSIYWTVVTITTVGYGDITPQTVPGKILSVIVMLCGYAIIAVPTGIVTVEMTKNNKSGSKSCSICRYHLDPGARYCSNCGSETIEIPAEDNR